MWTFFDWTATALGVAMLLYGINMVARAKWLWPWKGTSKSQPSTNARWFGAGLAIWGAALIYAPFGVRAPTGTAFLLIPWALGALVLASFILANRSRRHP